MFIFRNNKGLLNWWAGIIRLDNKKSITKYINI